MTRPYEEAAEIRTVTGWCCATCGRYHGDDEEAARYCHAKDYPCECGGRREKMYTHCVSCRARRSWERFDAKVHVDYDGSYVMEYDDDKFLDEDALREKLIDHVLRGDDRADARFMKCELLPVNARGVEDLIPEDELPEDFELKTDEINAVVDAWVKEHVGPFWQVTNTAINRESLPWPTEEELADAASD